MYDLLATKVTIPSAYRRSVMRERLIERLNTLWEYRLTLLCAPAGYGKTTLLTSWTSRVEGARVAWLSLDREDNEPLSFWRMLFHVAEVQRLPELSPLDTVEQATRALLTVLINEIYSQRTRVVLVLDDYHVIENQLIHDGLAFLLERMPANMAMIVASRSQPPLPLSRLKARRQLLSLTKEDLRFTSEEVVMFLRNEDGAQVSAWDVARLQERYEGWAAGLQLAVLAARGRVESPVPSRLLLESEQSVFDYLVEEVVAGLGEESQHFLLYTSVLTRMCAGLVNAVTEREDGQEMLMRLAQMNLFIVALDEKRQWYRYHHLFAETLLQLLQQSEPGMVAELHRRASGWYEKQGLINEAVEHALLSEDVQLARHLISMERLQLLSRGEMSRLRAWIERLPSAMVEADFGLCIGYFWTLANEQEHEKAGECLRHMQRIVSESDEETARKFAVGIYGASATYARHSNELERARDLQYQALNEVAEHDYRQRSYMWVHLAEIYWVMGEIGQAQQAILKGMKASELGKFDFFLTLSYLYLGHMQKMRGQVVQARASYQKVLELLEEQGKISWMAGIVHLCLGLLSYERNELVAARRHLLASEKVGRESGDVSTQFYMALLRVDPRFASDGTEEAREALASLVVQGSDFRRFFPLAGFIERYTLTLLAQGELGLAAFTLEMLREQAWTPLLQEDLLLAHGRLLLAQGEAGEIAMLLQPFLKEAERQGRSESIMRVRLLQALALQAQGKEERAQTQLIEALVLGERSGHIRTFVDEGVPVRGLLKALAGTSVKVSEHYRQQLLAAFPAEENAGEEQKGEIFVASASLSEREIEILRLLAVGRSNQEIAGQLTIAMSTLKTHLHRMYSKLGVSSRTQALACARQLRLL